MHVLHKGQKFNRLTVIEPQRTKSGQFGWLCQCECGNTTVTTASKLTSGHTKSCGCYAKEVSIENGKKPKKHGLAHVGGKATRLYRVWTHIRVRCNNPNTENFQYYGERGVKVCDEWNDYKTFHDWALSHGYRDDLTIDRIDVNGDYSPENCRWTTIKEQNRNKRTTLKCFFNGQVMLLKDVSNVSGINYQTLRYHLKKGDIETYLRGGKTNGIIGAADTKN